jgi:hypothetical protein
MSSSPPEVAFGKDHVNYHVIDCVVSSASGCAEGRSGGRCCVCPPRTDLLQSGGLMC